MCHDVWSTKAYSRRNPDEGDIDLWKRARFLRRCKDVLWNRWSDEYMKSLRERHNLEHKTKDMTVRLGDVVLINDSERNRGKWNIGIVVKLFPGRDRVRRAVRLRAVKSYLERAVQHLISSSRTRLATKFKSQGVWPRKEG